MIIITILREINQKFILEEIYLLFRVWFLTYILYILRLRKNNFDN